MKILITTDWYTPAVNGVVTSVKNLQRELERRGHEVRILTLSQSLHSWSRDGVTAIGSVNAGRIYPGARLRTAMAGRWVRELMDWRPDVIHSQCEFSTFFLARRIADIQWCDQYFCLGRLGHTKGHGQSQAQDPCSLKHCLSPCIVDFRTLKYTMLLPAES